MNKDTKDSLIKIAKDVAVLAATSLASMAVKLVFKKKFDIQFNDYPIREQGGSPLEIKSILKYG